MGNPAEAGWKPVSGFELLGPLRANESLEGQEETGKGPRLLCSVCTSSRGSGKRSF